MPVGDYLQGLAFLLVNLTLTGFVAGVTVRRAGYRGAPLVCAAGVAWIAALLAAHLIPAALGILSRESVLVAALLLAAIGHRAIPRAERAAEPSPQARPGGALSRAIAGAACLAALGQSLLYLVERAAVPLEAFDVATFHLPSVARWIQSGTLWQLDNLYPDYAFGNYPQNGDMLQLAAVLPFGNDAFARLVGYPLLALTAISVYALARELGAPRATAATFAAALAAIPVALLPALEEGQVDPLMLATFGCGLLFLARHARTGGRYDLVLAGLGLGLAFGSKWYALPYVLVTLALWVAAGLAARRPRGPLVREGALLGGLVAAGGGIWLVRNLVESSNPLFPQKVAVAGVTIFDAPRDTVREQIGFPLTHYAADPSVFREFVFPSWADTFQSAGALLLCGAVAAVVLGAIVTRRDPRAARPPVALLCAVLSLLLLLAYAATPNSALGPEGEPVFMGAAARYAIPALMLAAAVSAWAAGRLGRARPLVELAALAATVDGLSRTFEFSALGAVLAGLAAAGLLGAALALRRSPPRGASAVALSVAALVGGASLGVAGHRVQRDLNDGRYTGLDPVIDVLAAPGPRRTVAVTGVWSDRGVSPILPAFGPRLEHEVRYAGPLVGGMLRRPRSARELSGLLRSGRPDLLLVGRGGPPARTLREEGWARAEGFVAVAQSERFTLLRPP